MTFENLKQAAEAWILEVLMPNMSFAEQLMIGIGLPGMLEKYGGKAESFLRDSGLMDEAGNIDDAVLSDRIDRYVFRGKDEIPQNILGREFRISRKNVSEIISRAKSLG